MLPRSAVMVRRLIPTPSFLAVILAGSTMIFLYNIIKFGFSNLWFRSSSVEIYGDNITEFLVKGTVFPLFMSIAAVFGVVYYRQHRSPVSFLIAFYLFFLFFITYPPTGMARFKVATLYGAIIMLGFKKLRRGTTFTILLITGMFFAFPLFSVFRNADLSNVLELMKNSWNSVLNNVYSGDYDAYSSFASSVNYVSRYHATDGRQLLGVIFFFVPRILWPGKPIGSGAMLADKLNKNFSNISCQFFAEGYINFGFIGVIVFCVILAVIIKKMDALYWNDTVEGQTDTPISILYFYALFLLFFLLRGDLLSAGSYMVGAFVTISFVILLCNLFNKKGKVQNDI